MPGFHPRDSDFSGLGCCCGSLRFQNVADVSNEQPGLRTTEVKELVAGTNKIIVLLLM